MNTTNQMRDDLAGARESITGDDLAVRDGANSRRESEMELDQFEGHTPGPLACVELMAFAAGFAVEDGEGRTVARIMKTHGVERLPSRANAALFAAAPELLAEVRRLTAEADAQRRERDELGARLAQIAAQPPERPLYPFNVPLGERSLRRVHCRLNPELLDGLDHFEDERWKRIAENAQAVTTGGDDKGDYFEVPAHLMAALALALDEWPGAQGQAGAASMGTKIRPAAAPKQAEPAQAREDEAERLDWLLARLPGSVIRDLVGVMSNTRDSGEWRALIDKAAGFKPHNAI